MPGHSFDREEILRMVRLFHEPGDIVEMRIPNAKQNKVIFGYSDNAESFAKGVCDWEPGAYAGYYFTINPAVQAVFSRCANKTERWAKETTSDGEITKRRWLPIDLDPVRPAGISSDEKEHAAALEMARTIRAWLISKGWPANAFILADSGNGGHLPVRIELPNDDDAKALVSNCLKALDFIFSDEKVNCAIPSISSLISKI